MKGTNGIYDMKNPVLTYDNTAITFERLKIMLTTEQAETFMYSGDVMLCFKTESCTSYMDIVYGESLGYYLHYINKKENCERLSLGDYQKLTEVIEYDEDCYASVGLFITVDSALKEIEIFCRTGNITNSIDWITPNEVPESGNW